MHASHAIRAAALATALLIAGCTVGPNYKTPRAELPDQFDSGIGPSAETTPSTLPRRPAVDLARWWTSLEDPLLDSLIRRAVASNLDLGMAVARLQQVRAASMVVLGDEVPSLNFSFGAGLGSGNNETKGRIAPPLNAGANTTGKKEIVWAGGFDSGWEIDLFGRVRREIEAARANTAAATEARNDVLVTVVADVARSYVDLRSLQARLDIALQYVRTQEQTLDFMRRRLDRGLANELDVVLAERQLATARSRVEPLRAAISEAQRHIAILIGASPEALYGELRSAVAVSTSLPPVDPGLPYELIRRRPDIRFAERRLAAETAQIGVATANLFPRIQLTAGIGGQGTGLGRNPAGLASMYSLGPAVRWPVLDFGALDAAVQIEEYRARELLLAYRRTILQAVKEVEDAQANYIAQRGRLEQLKAAVDASQRAARLAQARYERGLTDFLNVLDAQRQLYDLQDQFAVAEEAVIIQFISLHKALGGGWQGYYTPPPPAPRPALIAAAERLKHPSAANDAPATADHKEPR